MKQGERERKRDRERERDRGRESITRSTITRSRDSER